MFGKDGKVLGGSPVNLDIQAKAKEQFTQEDYQTLAEAGQNILDQLPYPADKGDMSSDLEYLVNKANRILDSK